MEEVKENKFAKRVTQRELTTHKEIQTAKHPGGRPKKLMRSSKARRCF
jgi:hypothetical protein